MKYLILLSLLPLLAACVAEVPVDERRYGYVNRHNYDRNPHDNGYHRGWDRHDNYIYTDHDRGYRHD